MIGMSLWRLLWVESLIADLCGLDIDQHVHLASAFSIQHSTPHQSTSKLTRRRHLSNGLARGDVIGQIVHQEQPSTPQVRSNLTSLIFALVFLSALIPSAYTLILSAERPLWIY